MGPKRTFTPARRPGSARTSPSRSSSTTFWRQSDRSVREAQPLSEATAVAPVSPRRSALSDFRPHGRAQADGSIPFISTKSTWGFSDRVAGATRVFDVPALRVVVLELSRDGSPVGAARVGVEIFFGGQ